MPPRRAAPRIASALASVPPLVNTICPSPSAATSWARARFTRAAAASPSRCADDGLPKSSPRQRTTIAITSGRHGWWRRCRGRWARGKHTPFRSWPSSASTSTSPGVASAARTATSRSRWRRSPRSRTTRTPTPSSPSSTAARRASPAASCDSIYFGGGTPALWRPDALARVVARGRARRLGEPRARSPSRPTRIDCAPETLAALRDAGRQPAVDRRAVASATPTSSSSAAITAPPPSRAAVAAARAAGFATVSLDLIFALPGRTLDDWNRTLDAALGPRARAPLGLRAHHRGADAVRRRRRAPAASCPPPDEAAAAAVRGRARPPDRRRLRALRGLAPTRRPGRRAVHNSLYWRGAPSTSASGAARIRSCAGDDGGLRWSRTPRAVSRYLAGDAARREPRRTRPASAADDGVARPAHRRRDRRGNGSVRRPALDRLLARRSPRPGAEGGVRPTPRGLLFADEIGARVLLR